jgi:hypothetical protein
MRPAAAYQPAGVWNSILVPLLSVASRVGEQTMRSLNKMVWAALIAGATGVPVFAQGSMAGGASAAGGSTGGGSTTGGTGVGATLSSLGGTPVLSAPTSSGGNTGNSVSASNFLAMYYANPYYQGVLANALTTSSPPGGFGAVLNGASGTGGTIGSAAGGTTGGATAGRATTGGGKGGATTNNNNSGIIFPIQVQMSYACIADKTIAPPPIVPSQLQADLVAMIGRSKEVSNPATIQISAEANNVTIRGVAKDRDEARLVETMIRMTAGVGKVKNELAYPTKP